MLTSADMQSRRFVVSLMCLSLCLSTVEARAQELMERILAVVDDDPILLSEVDRALVLGIAESEEGEPERLARRRTLDWLIEQRLRFHEVERYGFSSVPEFLVDQQVQAIQERIGSPDRYQERLEVLGLDELSLQQLLARQIQVVTFVEERLGPRIFVGLSDIADYYENHVVPRLEAEAKSIPPIEELREPIRALLKEERLNQELLRWTEELRGKAEVLDFFEEKIRDLPPLVLTFSEESEESAETEETEE